MKICFCPLFRFSDLSRTLCAGKNSFQIFQISVKIQDDLITSHLRSSLCRILIVQFRLGLSFKPWSGMLDRNHRRHAVSDIRSRKIGIFFLQNTQLTSIIIHHGGEHRFKTCQMRTAFCIINIVTKAQNIFMKFIDILEYRLHSNSLTFPEKYTGS